jgi:hypothetical protein
LFAKLLEFFDDLLFFDAGAGEQTFKSGGCGAQGMEIGFQNWFTSGGNVKADGLAMPGYGDGISALQQRRHALTKFPYSYFGRGHIMCLVCFMCTHYNTTAAQALSDGTYSSASCGTLGCSGSAYGASHNVHYIETSEGTYGIEAPVSLGRTFMLGMLTPGGNSPTLHKEWFMDLLHDGDQVLFAAGCDKHHHCTFWLPNPDKVGKEFVTRGVFVPSVAPSNTTSLCGTGKLSASVSAEVCEERAQEEPVSIPVAQPDPMPQSGPVQQPPSVPQLPSVPQSVSLQQPAPVKEKAPGASVSQARTIQPSRAETNSPLSMREKGYWNIDGDNK